MKQRIILLVDSEKGLAQAKVYEQKGEVRILGIGNIPRGNNAKLLENYDNLKKVFDARAEALKWMKTWPKIKIIGDKNFKEFMTYGNTSLWWFTEFWFWNAHSFYDNSILDIFYSIEAAERILDKEKPDMVMAPCDGLLCSMVSLVAKSRGIETFFVPTKNFRKELAKKIRPVLVKYFKTVKEFLRKIPNQKLLHKTPGRIKILMFTHPIYRQAIIDVKTGKQIKEDSILGPVIRELGDCDVILVDTDPFGVLRLGFTLNSPGYKHIETYINKTIEKKISSEDKLFKKKWKLIEPLLNKALIYRNIELMPFLEQKFLEMFRRKFTDAVKYIEIAKEAVRIEKPNVLVIVDECGLYGKAAIFAGKQAKIPTIAIQHGLIGESSIEFLHTAEELSGDPSLSPNSIPDKTFVSGKNYNDILIRFGYPKGSAVTTGQPKYDILANAEKIFDKKKIRDMFGLKPEDKLLVFASQPWSNEINEVLLRSLFRSVKKIPEARLVIKLHPNEYNSSLHEKIAKEIGIDVSIIKDINIFELLYACDALITISSGAALDAMILNKPVIIANLMGRLDDVPYVDRGTAFGVYKDSDMLPTIRKALFDKKNVEKMDGPRRKFIFEHAYNIDGEASKRIAELIRKVAGQAT